MPHGAIQVPGDGQPIVMLADRQSTGGYPKIATVISADLPRLGQLRPGVITSYSIHYTKLYDLCPFHSPLSLYPC